MIPKFRVWDKQHKVMLPVVHMSGEGDSLSSLYARRDDNNLQWLRAGEYELMQFTGLRDKAGREIYRDDIVKLRTDLGDGTITEEIGVVIWEDCGFCLKLGDDLERHYFAQCDWQTHEVIGNIWENPDLVKEGGNA